MSNKTALAIAPAEAKGAELSPELAAEQEAFVAKIMGYKQRAETLDAGLRTANQRIGELQAIIEAKNLQAQNRETDHKREIQNMGDMHARELAEATTRATNAEGTARDSLVQQVALEQRVRDIISIASNALPQEMVDTRIRTPAEARLEQFDRMLNDASGDRH